LSVTKNTQKRTVRVGVRQEFDFLLFAKQKQGLLLIATKAIAPICSKRVDLRTNLDNEIP
jgi:hypothetical protein